MLHHFIVGIHLLTNGPVNIAKILCGDQVELRLALSGSVGLDQGRLIPVIHVANVFIDRRDAFLELSFLVQRGQEWNLFAHLSEFE